MPTWTTIARVVAAQGAAVLVTLARSEGSSPREVGARMVVAPDGSFSGTIGGGALEWGALAEAQALLAREGPMKIELERALGPDLGQCCGGRVVLTLEKFHTPDRPEIDELAQAEREGVLATLATPTPDGRLTRRIVQPYEGPAVQMRSGGAALERFGEEPTALYLFGAGHVGRALAAAIAPLPFAVTWADLRPDAIPAAFAPNITAIREGDPVALLGRAPDGAFVAVMTHSHALDLDLTIAALQAERFAYVGLIGSATKRARFTSAMLKMGMAAELVDSLVCPIGLTAIKDKAPAAIAASIVAQILIAREAAAARGHETQGAVQVRHG